MLNEIFLKFENFFSFFVSVYAKTIDKSQKMWYNYLVYRICGYILRQIGGVSLNINLKEISTEALAYLGDCVIELKVRELLVDSGISGSGNLNRTSLLYVKASAQAEAMRKIMPMLTDDEALVFKRGRNMSGGNVPKSATVSEYRAATGMEVLFGYLHIQGNSARIDELFNAAYSENKDE